MNFNTFASFFLIFALFFLLSNCFDPDPDSVETFKKFNLGKALKSAGSKVTSTAKSAVNTVKNVAEKAADKVGDVAEKAADKIGDAAKKAVKETKYVGGKLGDTIKNTTLNITSNIRSDLNKSWKQAVGGLNKASDFAEKISDDAIKGVQDTEKLAMKGAEDIYNNAVNKMLEKMIGPIIVSVRKLFEKINSVPEYFDKTEQKRKDLVTKVSSSKTNPNPNPNQNPNPKTNS